MQNITDLQVQVFTIPTLTPIIVRENGLLHVITLALSKALIPLFDHPAGPNSPSNPHDPKYLKQLQKNKSNYYNDLLFSRNLLHDIGMYE